MKLTCILLTVCCMGVNARSISQTMTLSAKQVPMKSIFMEIKKQTGYLVVCDLDILRTARPINIVARDMPINEFLNAVLKDQPLDFTIRNNTVFITSKKNPVTFYDTQPQLVKSTISGTVKDNNGTVLQGVSVMLQPLEKGTVTDEKGNFFFHEIASGFYALELSLVSYSTHKQQVYLSNVPLHVDITLEPSSDLQEEVIVSTGYQTISRERSAGSFSKPDMQILAERPGSLNILQRLDGLVAGLTVNNAPGASQNPFLIRGLSTIGIPDPQNPNAPTTGTNRNPLYVVDGVPLDDISTINPNDVADISVLKDATAASIWGARASNGVIIITTKKGAVNEKINLQYDGFVNLQGRPDLANMPVLNSRQFVTAASEIFTLQDQDNPMLYAQIYPWNAVSGYQGIANTGVAPHEVVLYDGYLGRTSPGQTQARLDSLALMNNRDQIGDLWYRNALLSSHTLSASGGGKIHSFYGSLTYTNTTSNRPQDRDNYFKINFRQDFRFNDRLQVYLITDLSNSLVTTKRNIAIDNRFYPYQLFRDGNGNNISVPYMRYLSDSLRTDYQSRSRIDLDYNPLDEVNRGYTKNDALLNRIVSGVSLKLFKGLRFEGTYGFIKGNRKTTSFDDESSYLVRSELLQFTVAPSAQSTPVYGLPERGGRYTTGQQTQRNWTVRNQLVYDKQWQKRFHQLTLLAGQESQEQLMVFNSNTLRGYDPLLQTFGAIDYKTLSSTGIAGTVMPNSGSRSTLANNIAVNSETQVRFRSYYANGAYTLNDKYSLNASWRIDGSNLFGLDKSAQNKPVWSAGVKWRLSGEDFLSATDWLDNLAFRATYGITGNAPSPGTASSYDILSAASGGNLPGGSSLVIATAANPKLTWESTRSLNLGLDFSLWRGRVEGFIDVYKKTTDNLLGQVPVNSLTGYASIVGNLGTLENKGLEITLTSLNVQGKYFNWSTQLALAFNKNRVVKLNTITQLTTGAQQVQQKYVAGYSAFALFAYDYAGLDDKGDPQISLQDKTVTSARNVTVPDDIIYMGTYQPVWSGGITNRLNYRSFRLIVNTVLNLGHVMRRDVNLFYAGRLRHANMSAGGFTTGNIHSEFTDRWKTAGDENTTNIPSYLVNPATSDSRRDVSYYQYGDINVVSASFIKLRDITLSYTLPTRVSGMLKAKFIDLRLQVGNVMLWKANDFGIDPEFQDAFTGVRNVLSQQHTLSFGMHLNF